MVVWSPCESLVPNEDRVAEEDAVPAEIVDEMRGLGLFGLSIPEEYGGLGLSMEELRPLARRARVKLVPTRELQ